MAKARPALDQPPRYRALVDYLLEKHADTILAGTARGLSYEIQCRHDSSCPTLTTGGPCTCQVVVDLIERGNPNEN